LETKSGAWERVHPQYPSLTCGIRIRVQSVSGIRISV
jgi:hypothetical protein